MGSVTERVFAFAATHSMFGPGDRVGVAVSGGADSVCLLQVMLELRARWPVELIVIHVDHQLRGEESDEDARFVGELAERHGLPFHLERVCVSEAGNLEENARRLRLGVFERFRAAGLVNQVATGHTASDQAETVLFRFLRGSGTTGMAGILPVTGGIVRPLLAIKRIEVEAYLKERGLGWREDSTNQSNRFSRNRIRQELIPMLERVYQPALVDQLAHVAAMSRDEDLFWEEETEKYYRVLATGGGMPVLDCGSLKELPVALRRRLIRRAVRGAKGDLQRIDYRHVESMMALLDRRGGGRVVAPGVEVVRSMGWIRFTPAGYRDVHDRSAVLLAAPGEVTLPGGICLRLRSVPPERGYNGGEAGNRVSGPDKEDKLDWDRMDGPLTLRWWVPGDAYRRTGAKQAEKIKQMFQMARIPLWERHFWPIIEAGKDIVWSRRFGPSAEHQATSSSRRVLGVREIPAE